MMNSVLYRHNFGRCLSWSQKDLTSGYALLIYFKNLNVILQLQSYT